MNRVLVLLLLLPFGARSEELYRIRQLSENELLDTYTSLMHDACLHADQFWHDWPLDTRAGFWGSGRSDQMNEGIRAVSGMTLTSASLLKYSSTLNDSFETEVIPRRL